MRLIDADKLKEALEDDGLVRSNLCAIKHIDNAPTVDAEPVKHGRWERPYLNYYGHPCHCCSICGFKASHYDKNYCSYCGAKMDEVSE